MLRIAMPGRARFLALLAVAFLADHSNAPGADKAGPAPADEPLPAGAVVRLGTLRFRHDATSVAYSPDGKLVASGGADNKICLFDAANGQKLRTLAGHRPRSYTAPRRVNSPLDVLVGATGQGNVSCLAFSPDGKTLVSGGWDSSLRLWALATGKELRKVYAHEGLVAAVAFAPDGKSFVSRGGLDGVVRIWQAGSAVQVRQITGLSKANPWRFNRELGLAVSPDSKTLAVGDLKGARLYDLHSGREVKQLPGHRSVLAVAFSPDGKLLATGGVDQGHDQNSLRLYDLAVGQALRRCELPKNEPPINLAFSPDGSRLAAAVEEDDVRIFDVATGKPVERLAHYWPSRVRYAPDGKTLVSALGPALRFWDAATGNALQGPAEGHQAGVSCAAVSPDGRLVATGGEALRLWSAQEGKLLRSIAVRRGASAVAFAPDGKLLASAGRDGVVRLWDPHTGQQPGELKGHKLMLCGLAFSPDGKVLASGDVQSTVRLWDVPGRRELRRIDNRSGTERLAFAFSPDGKRLACAGAWNDSSFLPRVGAVIKINGKEVKSDGVWRIQGVEMVRKEGYNVLVWEAASGKELARLGGLHRALQGVAFSPDGKTIAASGEDGVVALWDAPTRRQRLVIRAHSGAGAAAAKSAPLVAFTPDYRLVSAGRDKSVRVWDPRTGRELGHFDAPEAISALALSADGHLLVTGSVNGTALVWDMRRLATAPAAAKDHVILLK